MLIPKITVMIQSMMTQDYEDNIPLQIVQEGLNAMSRESPICYGLPFKEYSI